MKEKETYTSPECKALEMQCKGVIAVSVDPKFVKPFNDEVDW